MPYNDQELSPKTWGLQCVLVQPDSNAGGHRSHSNNLLSPKKLRHRAQDGLELLGRQRGRLAACDADLLGLVDQVGQPMTILPLLALAPAARPAYSTR